MRALAILTIALSSVWATSPAFAEGEGDAPQQAPPTPAQAQGDAWDQAIHSGMQQEGRPNKDQIVQREKDDEKEVEAAENLRKQLRLAAFLGIGGGIGLEHTLENRVQLQKAGPEFQIGAGVRKGISLDWEFQGRGLVTIIDLARDSKSSFSSFSNTLGPPRDKANLGVGLSLDGTARYHFGGITHPWYFGFGGRVDFIRVSGDRTVDKRVGTIPISQITTTSATLTVAPLAVAEVGVVLLDQRVDLSVRMAAGLGFHMGAMGGVAF